MAEDKIEKAFEQWKRRSINNRINAICKPCWELNYCPYGALVEDFPLSEDEYYSCKIFGHECPVFYTSEPFTETKKFRNITRNIPQETKYKVLRRDNCVCQICKKNISDEEINFDHIIPWSKGGSSDVSNIRLLCSECNKSRGNSFEADLLITHMQEVFYNPYEITIDMLKNLLRLFSVKLILENRYLDLNEDLFCLIINSDDKDIDSFMFSRISQIADLLHLDTTFLTTKKKLKLLQYRWGIIDSKIHSIIETCFKFKVDTEYYVEQEMLLLRQLGFILVKKHRISQEYFSLLIDNEEMESMVYTSLSEINKI